MIPAYDFSPVGEGVTFLPKGNREGSCARSRLHDSTDLECRGPVSGAVRTHQPVWHTTGRPPGTRIQSEYDVFNLHR